MKNRYNSMNTPQEPDISKLFCQLLNRYGAVVFNDHDRLHGLMADMAPRLTRQRWLADVAARAGAYTAICSASGDELPYVARHYISLLSSRYSLDPSKAETAVAWLCTAMGQDLTQDAASSAQYEASDLRPARQTTKTNRKPKRRGHVFRALAAVGLAVIIGILVLHSQGTSMLANDAAGPVAEAVVADQESTAVAAVGAETEDSGYGFQVSRPVAATEAQQPESSGDDFTDTSAAIIDIPPVPGYDQEYSAFAPLFHWDFTRSMAEEYGQPIEIYGSPRIVTVNGVTAARFDGYGNYMQVGTGFNYTENCTFNIVLNCSNTKKDYASFFSKYETSREGPYAYAINQGRVNLWWNENKEDDRELESRTVIRENTWYDITVVKEGLHFSLYINGVLDSEATLSSVMQNDDAVTIGCQKLMFGDESQLFFEGLIRDIYVFDTALSSTDVQNLSNRMLEGLPQ